MFFGVVCCVSCFSKMCCGIFVVLEWYVSVFFGVKRFVFCIFGIDRCVFLFFLNIFQ